MATGDWSFPRSGCSCIRFRTQVATRPWVGAMLTSAGNNLTTPTRKMHFLKYEWSYGAPFQWSGSAEWSTEPATYGDTSAIIGSQPQFSFGPKTSDYAYLASIFGSSGVKIGAPGVYVFTGGRQSAFSDPSPLSYPTNTFTLNSFTPGPSYEITLRETCNVRQGAASFDILVTQKWSNEFLPARMEVVLTDDLENERPYGASGLDTRNYFKSQSFSGVNSAKGGMLEYDDDNYALQPFIVDSVGFVAYAHAARWVSKNFVYIVGESTGKMTDGPFLARCKIYEPGLHSVQSRTLIDTDNSIVVPCQSFPVECPAVSQDALFIIPPPEKDREKKEIYFNKADCTF